MLAPPSRCRALLAALAVVALPRVASASPYTLPAPPVDSYEQSLGFLPPTDPSADLDARSPEAHEQLEAYLLEGADAGAETGDPVLLAWFAAADASLAPWRLSNCGDYDHDPAFDCPWGTLWQVGLGCQVTDDYAGVAAALAATQPGRSARDVGQEVLDLGAIGLAFPDVDAATLAADPAGATSGRSNGYWLATLMRDLRVGAYLEAPPATAWPCYRAGAPSWCGSYRQPANWQAYSDVLSEVIVSWNEIEADWASAPVPDVIVDDLSPGFTIDVAATPDGSGGFRGRYLHAPAQPSATTTGIWNATLPSGRFRVSAFVPYASGATAPDATMTVYATDGPHDVAFDESQTGGRFVVLGDFHFDAGIVTVKMTDRATSGEVGWDA
ncbi:MAG TPA: hypothetical protein VHB21_26965, partial [Minicystis sp.]|nr:hypothetical protein [Minicystis sp.]